MADGELAKFRRALACAYRDEIAAGQTAGYALFARKRDAGDHILFIAPGALDLLQRLPSWKRRFRRYKGTPDLKGFEVLPVQ